MEFNGENNNLYNFSHLAQSFRMTSLGTCRARSIVIYVPVYDDCLGSLNLRELRIEKVYHELICFSYQTKFSLVIMGAGKSYISYPAIGLDNIRKIIQRQRIGHVRGYIFYAFERLVVHDDVMNMAHTVKPICATGI